LDCGPRAHSRRHRPRRRAIQYPTGVSDRAERPRRTGSPAFAGDDSRGWGLRFKFQTAAVRRHSFAISQHGMLESLLFSSHPLQAEGAGNAGRPMRPQAAYAMVVVERTRVVRSHRFHPAFPAQWFTAYIALSPATGLFCHRRPWSCLHELDTSVGVSGPHDFAVRIRRPRLKAPSASTASRPALVTIAKRPSSGTGRHRNTSASTSASSAFSENRK